jgi:hypothetical protein
MEYCLNYKKSFIYIMYNCIYTLYKIKYITIYNTMENYKLAIVLMDPILIIIY